MSIGFTAIHAQDAASGTFVRADRAGRCAKGRGRNQVSWRELLVAAGQLDDEEPAGEVELF